MGGGLIAYQRCQAANGCTAGSEKIRRATPIGYIVWYLWHGQIRRRRQTSISGRLNIQLLVSRAQFPHVAGQD